MSEQEPDARRGDLDLNKEIVSLNGVRFTVRQLRERVSVYEPGIIIFREVDRGHQETLEAMGTRIEELSQGLTSWGVVIDLADATRAPASEYGRFIPKYFASMNERANGTLKHVGCAFVGNPVVRVAAVFIVGRITEFPFTVHKNVEDAAAAVRQKL